MASGQGGILEELIGLSFLTTLSVVIIWMSQAFKPASWPALLGVTFPRMIFGLSILIIGSVVSGLYCPLFVLTENQILYISSTQAQVVAAVYALTLTGFIFHSDQLNKMVVQDETKKEAADVIRKSAHSEIAWLSFASVACIFCALITIAVHNLVVREPYIFAVNAAASLFVGSLLLTVNFVLNKVHPDLLQRASDIFKQEVEKNIVVEGKLAAGEENELDDKFPDETTSVEDGLENSLEEVDDEPAEPVSDAKKQPAPEPKVIAGNRKFLPHPIFDEFYRETSLIYTMLGRAHRNPVSRVVRTHRVPIAQSEILRRASQLAIDGVIEKSIYLDIVKLFGYRNALTHGDNKKVPGYMLSLAKNTRLALQRSLSRAGYLGGKR